MISSSTSLSSSIRGSVAPNERSSAISAGVPARCRFRWRLRGGAARPDTNRWAGPRRAWRAIRRATSKARIAPMLWPKNANRSGSDGPSAAWIWSARSDVRDAGLRGAVFAARVLHGHHLDTRRRPRMEIARRTARVRETEQRHPAGYPPVDAEPPAAGPVRYHRNPPPSPRTSSDRTQGGSRRELLNCSVPGPSGAQRNRGGALLVTGCQRGEADARWPASCVRDRPDVQLPVAVTRGTRWPCRG